MSRSFRIGVAALIGLVGVNVAGLTYHYILQSKMQNTKRPPAVKIGSKFPVFSGVDLTGEMWSPGDVPCRVIRVTDDYCSYCKKDKPTYAAFINAARQASCEIIEVAPRAGQMASDPRPGIVQIKYVTVDIAPMLFPFATPETLVLDKDWSVKWLTRGVIDEKSLVAGVAALKEVKATEFDSDSTLKISTR